MITVEYLEKFAGTPIFRRAVVKLMMGVYELADCDTDDIDDIRGWTVLAEKLGMFEIADLLCVVEGLQEWNDDNS